MKHSALAIVLLSALQYQQAFADSTLDFKLVTNNNSKQTMSYQIRQHQLRLTDSASRRINLFNRTNQEFTSQVSGSREVSLLNEKLLKERIIELNQKRKEHLAQVEAKMQKELNSMDEEAQKIATSLINQLKYPELYGEHTLLKLEASNTSKTINQIECRVYHLNKQQQRVKEFCVTDPAALKLSDEEYSTLRSFYQFDYKTQSSIMLAMGKSNFDLIDYEVHNMPGVIIELISYKDGKINQHQILTKNHNKTLDKKLFGLQAPSSSNTRIPAAK